MSGQWMGILMTSHLAEIQAFCLHRIPKGCGSKHTQKQHFSDHHQSRKCPRAGSYGGGSLNAFKSKGVEEWLSWTSLNSQWKENFPKQKYKEFNPPHLSWEELWRTWEDRRQKRQEAVTGPAWKSNPWTQTDFPQLFREGYSRCLLPWFLLHCTLPLHFSNKKVCALCWKL